MKNTNVENFNPPADQNNMVFNGAAETHVTNPTTETNNTESIIETYSDTQIHNSNPTILIESIESRTIFTPSQEKETQESLAGTENPLPLANRSCEYNKARDNDATSVPKETSHTTETPENNYDWLGDLVANVIQENPLPLANRSCEYNKARGNDATSVPKETSHTTETPENNYDWLGDLVANVIQENPLPLANRSCEYNKARGNDATSVPKETSHTTETPENNYDWLGDLVANLIQEIDEEYKSIAIWKVQCIIRKYVEKSQEK